MNRIILALDGMQIEEALSFLQEIDTERKATDKELLWGIKLNTLLLHDGVHLVNLLKQNGLRVFADAKLYDIPQTVTHSLNLLDAGGSDIITVHCSAKYKPDNVDASKIAGVTVLTSLNEDDCKNIYNSELNDVILHLATYADIFEYGYIVCSPQDLELLKELKIKKICPGVRPDWYKLKHDQQRVMTPQEAINKGVDLIVIGRPITKAENRIDALLRLNEDLGYL